MEARPQAGVEAQSAVRPGAGAAAPSRRPSMSQRPPVPGPRPMPRAHGGQEQGCTAQLGASAQCQQDWLPAVSTPHLLLIRRRGPHVRLWALAVRWFRAEQPFVAGASGRLGGLAPLQPLVQRPAALLLGGPECSSALAGHWVQTVLSK